MCSTRSTAGKFLWDCFMEEVSSPILDPIVRVVAHCDPDIPSFEIKHEIDYVQYFRSMATLGNNKSRQIDKLFLVKTFASSAWLKTDADS